jgi:hypothetical protein
LLAMAISKVITKRTKNISPDEKQWRRVCAHLERGEAEEGRFPESTPCSPSQSASVSTKMAAWRRLDLAGLATCLQIANPGVGIKTEIIQLSGHVSQAGRSASDRPSRV